MPNAFKTGLATLCLTAGLAALAPGARAAAYFDAAAWSGALTGAVAQYGTVTLSGWSATSVEYQDSFGRWTQASAGVPVSVWDPAHPSFFITPSSTGTRSFMNQPGGLGASFTCYSPIYPCLGAYRVTFTLPYEIIGLSGTLGIGADYWPQQGAGFLPELQASGYTNGTAWKTPGASTFYGLLLDAPTNQFTVSWTSAPETNSDNGAGFRISNASVVRVGAAAATAVPEPASIALFGAGLLGLVGVARRRR